VYPFNLLATISPKSCLRAQLGIASRPHPWSNINNSPIDVCRKLQRIFCLKAVRSGDRVTNLSYEQTESLHATNTVINFTTPLRSASSRCTYIREGADKSLARTGKKQSTATKLGIYSTYSPRSSINFLARCSNFFKPLKKEFRRLSAQPGLSGSNDLRVGRKMATFQLFFSPGNRW